MIDALEDEYKQQKIWVGDLLIDVLKLAKSIGWDDISDDIKILIKKHVDDIYILNLSDKINIEVKKENQQKNLGFLYLN